MTESVNVREIQTLSDLKNALGRFAERTTSGLQAFDAETRRTQEWLRERVLHWQREVERARVAVQRAEAALHHCESQVYVDRDGHAHYPDCSQYRRALQQAQQALVRAEQSLAVATRWQSRVEQGAQQYRVHGTRMQQITTTQTDQGKAYLDRKIGELNRYASLSMGVGAGAANTAIPTSATGMEPGRDVLIQPGPFAGESIPARSHERDFSPAERAEIDRIGRATGCHSCGTRDPGTRSGHFVLDHQPPNQLNMEGELQRLYPHCLRCSRLQGLQVVEALRRRP